MKKKLILRLSNEMGNQMFMYAAGYTFAKKMNRELYIDNESAFLLKKNISKYGLDGFNFLAEIAESKYKFLNFKGYIIRKFKKKINNFRFNKDFFIEGRDNNKITFFDDSFIKSNFANDLYVEGHFESEKYFLDYKNDIINKFSFKDKHNYIKNDYFNLIKNSNSISICIRQNRFSEKTRGINTNDKKKSEIFKNEQINYIKRSIDILKKKINNPKFFIWSNDFTNLDNHFSSNEFTFIDNKNFIGKKTSLDLFLMTQCKNFVVIPSSYNWWGAYLSDYKDKIVIRPDHKNFSNYKINNKDFWPDEWLVV